MTTNEPFTDAANSMTQVVPDAWQQHEYQRAVDRAACPSVAIDQQRLRAKLDEVFALVFPLDHPTALSERNRAIVERRWIDGATRRETADEFNVSPYRVKAIEDYAFKKLIPHRHRFIDDLDSVPDWLRILNQARPAPPPKHRHNQSTL